MIYKLEEAGYKIYHAKTFKEGYSLLRFLEHDLVILNYDNIPRERLHYALNQSSPTILLTDFFGLPDVKILLN